MTWRLWSITGICFVLLSGCQVLNFQTQPKVQPDCDYAQLTGVEFKFNQLGFDQQQLGFNHIYVAQSKQSATLPASYQGMTGKLTGEVFNRYYAPLPRTSIFKDDDYWDRYYYRDFYLTPAQREAKQRAENFVFQQAILQNCQIVYISVDSLVAERDNPKLIESAALTILSSNNINKE